MKKIKSYTGIWNVEKVLYAINDFNLPFPVTFTQITWFVIMILSILVYTFFTRMFDFMLPLVVKYSIVAA